MKDLYDEKTHDTRRLANLLHKAADEMFSYGDDFTGMGCSFKTFKDFGIYLKNYANRLESDNLESYDIYDEFNFILYKLYIIFAIAVVIYIGIRWGKHRIKSDGRRMDYYTMDSADD